MQRVGICNVLCNWSSLDSHVTHEYKTDTCGSAGEDCTQCILNAADVADCHMNLSKGNALMISCGFVVVRVLMEECGAQQHLMGLQLFWLSTSA